MLTGLRKEDLLQELMGNQELLTADENDESSSGSDSDPSADNLDPTEFAELFPEQPKKRMSSPEKIATRRPISNKKRAVSIRVINKPRERKIEPKKCGNCGQLEAPGHRCPQPRPRPRLPQPRRSNLYNTSMPYYNAQGKKVRDQATQTDNLPRPEELADKPRSFSQRGTPVDFNRRTPSDPRKAPVRRLDLLK